LGDEQRDTVNGPLRQGESDANRPVAMGRAADMESGRESVDVSVVLPCLNEGETVAICVRKARQWFESARLRGEVIVVDNGSTDRSREEAQGAGARVIDEPRRGYGAAHRRGFAEARGNIIVMADADDTYDLSDLSALIEPLGRGYDMVVGNRLKTLSPGSMTWSHRFIGTPLLTALLSLFSGSRLGDSQCGLRAFTREAYERLDLRSPGMELASEMILKGARKGLRMTEVPIPYHPRVAESKLSTFRDGWRHLRFLLLHTPTYAFFLPGVVLFLIGLLSLGITLATTGGIRIGSLDWQPLFAGGILLAIGSNSLILGVATSLYAESKGIVAEGRLIQFYRDHLSLERVLFFGVALLFMGGALDAYIFYEWLRHGEAAPNVAGIAAAAQSCLIIGANVCLGGFLAALIDIE
jgi:glycosyltransferase involved in cell wall biosynthesis